LEPVITELNFSGNLLDLKSYEKFNDFLATQFPSVKAEFQTQLSHLNLSQCFLVDVNACMNRLFSFFETREIWGLEICGIEPNSNLIHIRGLCSLNIGKNQLNRGSAEILKQFIRESRTITEIGIDDVVLDDPKDTMMLYLDLLRDPQILAFDRPRTIFQKFPNHSDTQKIRALLQNKRHFSNTVERLLSAKQPTSYETVVRIDKMISEAARRWSPRNWKPGGREDHQKEGVHLLGLKFRGIL
jgi:hypothetical protein